MEAALLLHEYLSRKGVRKNCSISLVVPFELPIPPAYGTSKALLKSFEKKNIRYIPENMVGSIDPAKQLAVLVDGTELPFDVFLGIPEHRVPKVVEESGMVFDEWIPVNKRNLKTRFPHVYAIGDVTSVGAPKAGMFAEGIFFSNPSPTGIHFEASLALADEKKSFETFRKARWFGISE